MWDNLWWRKCNKVKLLLALSAKLTSINVNVENIDNKTTYHVELALVVDELRDCERDDGTRSQGKVSVDKRPLLFVSISPATIKTRPEYPQEYSTYIMEITLFFVNMSR